MINRLDTLSAPSLRPKVHRLPAKKISLHRRYGQELRQFSTHHRFLLLTALVALGGVASATGAIHHVLVPQDEFVPLTLEGESVTGDSRANHVTDTMMPHFGKTLIIEDKSDRIVGQMAKIPPQNEQFTDIKSVSEVDGKAGRELLAIISKY